VPSRDAINPLIQSAQRSPAIFWLLPPGPQASANHRWRRTTAPGFKRTAYLVFDTSRIHYTQYSPCAPARSLADSASRKPEAAIHQLIPQSLGGHYRPSHKKRIGKWVRAASLGLLYWSGSSVDKYTFQTTSTARSPISILRSPPLWSGWSEDHTGLMRKCRPISEKTKHLRSCTR
jgi:hypothetical protein